MINPPSRNINSKLKVPYVFAATGVCPTAAMNLKRDSAI